MSPKIIAFGNPLLDVTISDEGAVKELLKEFALERNNAILATTHQHTKLFSTLSSSSKKALTVLSAGGSAQNTLRCAAAGLPAGSCVFCGAVGDDEEAALLKRCAEQDGLKVFYYQNRRSTTAFDERHDENTKTGICACLVSNNDRSLVAKLGASSAFPLSHAQSKAICDEIRQSQIIYFTGFFISSSLESIRWFLDASWGGGGGVDKMMAFNLSAPFVCEQFGEIIFREIAPKCTFVFGNAEELQKLAQKCSVSIDEDDSSVDRVILIAEALSRSLQENPHPQKSPFIIITQGAQPTIIAHARHPTLSIPVLCIDESKIVDCNGAGDAFVGGFLSSIILSSNSLSHSDENNHLWLSDDLSPQHPIADAVKNGHRMAAFIIQQSGVQVPKDKMAFGQKQV